MKVLVCGGREYNDTEHVFEVLDHVHFWLTITHVIHGAARGADTKGRLWADARGIPQTPYYANWSRYGDNAGPVRNQLMIDEGKPEFVVAFPGGNGTADMVTRATAAGLQVLRPVLGEPLDYLDHDL